MPTTDADENFFEERAERLSRDELEAWTVLTDTDRATLKKLKGPGMKLLSGPRGSGKSTLFRKAYFDLIDSEHVLVAYINYSHSLALEPLFFSHANALALFRQWVLRKIILGLVQTFHDASKAVPERLAALAENAKTFIQSLERGEVLQEEGESIAPSILVEEIESLIADSHASRCVLLLDDAAHAFSSEQQREFFELFRQLRSRIIAPKAAVYPGITAYSHSFNVSHEAELLVAWCPPSEDDYLKVMTRIAKQRLPPELYERLGANATEYIEILALASFGQPRGFLNMLSQLVDVVNDSRPLSRSVLLKAVQEHSEYLMSVFSSLASKLPRFAPYVRHGEIIKQRLVNGISLYNRRALLGASRRVPGVAVIVGITAPIPAKLERILKFFEYSGIVRALSDHSRGDKGIYKRYLVHYALLISDTALGLGQSYKNQDLIDALRKPDQHAYFRVQPSNLVDTNFDETCVLEMPACPNCQAPRLAEEQKFCARCGNRLTDASVYKELLQSRVEHLPIPQRKIDDIAQFTQIKTVLDLITDNEQQISQIPYVGRVWTRRIRTAAEEFISV